MITSLNPAVAVLVLSALANPGLRAAERTVYRGSLEGAGEIVMELQAAPAGELQGRYFYPARGVDIPLAGFPDKLIEPMPLSALADDARDALGDVTEGVFAHAAAHFEGHIADGIYAGRWVPTKGGRPREFRLREVARYDPDALAPDATETITDAIAGGIGSELDGETTISMHRSPYLFLKLAGHAQPVGEAFGDAAVAYRMWVDPRTVVPFPRLDRHPDPHVLAAANRWLEQQHWRLSEQALACAATAYTETHPAAGTLGGIDEESVQVAFLNAALMSIRVSGSTYCGGAHPNNHNQPYVIDLARGTVLDWNRLFDAFAVGEYGTWQPSPVLAELARRVAADVRYVHRGQKPLSEADDVDPYAAHGDDPVEYAGCGLWPQYLGLSLESPDRLVFNVTGVGHALGVCLGPHASLPFSAVEDLLKPAPFMSEAKQLLMPSVIPAPRP